MRRHFPAVLWRMWKGEVRFSVQLYSLPLNKPRSSLTRMSRSQVLSLYRRILRVARTWKAESEKSYMKEEARALFRKNKDLTDPVEIKLCVEEANSRIEMALHYNSPYPRLLNVPPNAVPKTRKRQKAQERIRKQAKPVYMHSYDDVDK